MPLEVCPTFLPTRPICKWKSRVVLGWNVLIRWDFHKHRRKLGSTLESAEMFELYSDSMPLFATFNLLKNVPVGCFVFRSFRKKSENIVLATMEVQIKSARISTSAMATIEFAGLIQAALLVANDGQGVHVRDLYVYSEGRGTENALDVYSITS